MVLDVGLVLVNGETDLKDLIRQARTGAWGADNQLNALLGLLDVADDLRPRHRAARAGAGRMGVLRCIAWASSQRPRVRRSLS